MNKSIVCQSSLMVSTEDCYTEDAIKECGYGLRRIEIHKINNELIDFMIALKIFESDRRKDNDRIEKLETEFSKGNIITFRWAIAYKRKTNEFLFVRVNGQHSSMALKEVWKNLKNSKSSNLVATVEIFEYDENKGFANLYSSYDSLVSARKNHEISEIMRIGYGYNEVRPDIFKAIASGINYSFGTNYKSKSYKERLELMTKYPKFVKFMNSIMMETTKVYKKEGKGKSKSVLSDRGFIRVIFEIFNKDEEAARSFANAIIRPNIIYDIKTPKFISPIIALREEFINIFINGKIVSKILRNDKPSMSYMQVACYTLVAFNCWQEGKYIQKLDIAKELKKIDGNDKGVYTKLYYEPILGISPSKRECLTKRNYELYVAPKRAKAAKK